MIRSVVLAMVLLGVISLAEALDVDPQPYQTAASRGAVGAVSGRARAEATRPNGVDEPLPGVSVTLLPRSEAFLAHLEVIKRRARNDANSYPASARALHEARREYERALSDRGAGELVRYSPAGPDGAFELPDVPAGAWLLVAQRAVYVNKGSGHLNKRDLQIFAPRQRLVGYYAVTVWVREVIVTRGETTAVDLTDRNIWLTAIVEERALDTGR